MNFLLKVKIIKDALYKNVDINLKIKSSYFLFIDNIFQ
jgi:hypothetical protein